MCWSSDVKNEEAEAGFDDHSRELLENISIEQKFEVTYVDIEELSKKVIFLKKISLYLIIDLKVNVYAISSFV